MLRRIVVSLLLVGLTGLAAWYATRPEPLVVRTELVGSGSVESSVANTRAGTVKACLRSRLTPSTGGQVARLHVNEGDRVAVGQRLMELWNEDLSARVRHARVEAEAAVSRVEEICLGADVARREADRLRPLHKRGMISEDQLDVAGTEALSKAAGCRAAEAQRQVLLTRIGVVSAELERTVLRAPFRGVIAEVTAEVGEFVTPSPTGVATLPAIDLIDYGCVFVSAPVDEVDAPVVAVDQSVRVTLDAFGERVFPGRIRRVAPYVLDVEKQARTVEVEVDFEQETVADELLPGYSADIEVVVATRERVLRVPTEAILEGDHVLVLTAGVLAERRIETGLGNWRWTEVVSGLDEGDRVVLSVDAEGVAAGAAAVADETQSQ